MKSIFKKSGTIFLKILATTLLLVFPVISYSANNNIVVVHSYHKNFHWVKNVNKGINDYINGKKAFGIKANQNVRNTSLSYFYMNAKEHPNDKRYLSNIGKNIINKLEEIKPTATIICDDEALEYVAKPLLNNPEHKFVFLGVNNDPREYGVVWNYESPEYNVTGLISEHPFLYSIKMITEIFPHFKNIIIYFDDSATGQGIYKNLIRHIARLDESITKHIKKTIISNDWSLWKKTISSNQDENNIFIFGSFYTLKGPDGKHLSEKEVISWITSHSKVPELTVLSAHIADGLLMSISNPAYVHGYEATHRVSQIFEGKPISKIPVTFPKQKAVHVNMERAKSINASIPVDIIAMSRYFDELGY